MIGALNQMQGLFEKLSEPAALERHVDTAMIYHELGADGKRLLGEKGHVCSSSATKHHSHVWKYSLDPDESSLPVTRL